MHWVPSVAISTEKTIEEFFIDSLRVNCIS